MAKPKILLISNADCDHGGLGLKLYDRFLEHGYSIDYLSLYPVPDRTDILSVFPPKGKLYKLKNLFKIAVRLVKKPFCKYVDKYCFFNCSDRHNPVSMKVILEKIPDKYDILIVYFWQNFITPNLIETLYQRDSCKVFFMMADYGPLAGGCHYFCDCDRFEKTCGKCPAWQSSSSDDFTHDNVMIRKRVYDKVNPIITGNSHMQKVYERSYLLKDRVYMKTYGTTDLEFFKKRGDTKALREKYGIPEHKDRIFFFGCQAVDDPRKGIKYLIDAFNLFADSLSDQEKERILLLIAGNGASRIKNLIKLDYQALGFVNLSSMPEIYSISTCLVSPSVNDAGPSMVNQSLSCGTPVIAFEVGVALDCIETGETGYRARLKDSTDLCNGIRYIYNMTDSELSRMQTNCREKAEELFSPSKSISRFEQFF